MDNQLINRVKVYIMCFLHTMMFYFSISRVCLKAMQCDATFGALYSFTNFTSDYRQHYRFKKLTVCG